MIRIKQINRIIDQLRKRPDTPTKRFLLDCLMELSAYKLAEELGILVRAEEKLRDPARHVNPKKPEATAAGKKEHRYPEEAIRRP